MCSSPTKRCAPRSSSPTRYVTDRMRPDKAIDALDEACAHMQAVTEYTPRTEALIRDRIALLKQEAKAEQEEAQREREAVKTESSSAFERFGAELEALFIGMPEPVAANGDRPTPETTARPAPRPPTLAPVEAALARQLMEEGIVMRGHDVARVVGLMSGLDRGLGDGIRPMKFWLPLLSLLALGCRERAPVGDGPFADKVALDIPQIEKALGVKFKTPPKLELRSRDQVRDFLLEKLREPEVVKQIANQEATYKLLGMLPDTMHLTDFFVRVLTEQIIGYYDPKTKVLYVVNGAPEEYAGITIMHELVHALQDQYMNLDSLEHISGDDDRAAAVQAVIEGQATYEQIYLMAGGSGNLAAQLPGGWESMRADIREAQKTQPVFSSAPMVIQETLLFPYINGAEFVRRFKDKHTGQLPIDRFPVSTKQLMHDSAYFAKSPDVPSEVTLAADCRPARSEQLRRVRHAAVHLSSTRAIRISRFARRTAGTATAMPS